MSIKPETAKRLHDVSVAGHELMEFCADRTREDLDSDRVLQLVVQRLIEIIGEALHQAEIHDPSIVERIPDIRDIVGTRNRLIHGYDSINHRLVWDMVTLFVPSLVSVVDTILEDAPKIGP